MRRSVQKIKDAYAEKDTLADVTNEVQNARENEVVVKFKITEHKPVTVRRITFIGNEHVSDSELRDQMQTGNGAFSPSGRRAVPTGRVRARRLDAGSALYYDKG